MLVSEIVSTHVARAASRTSTSQRQKPRGARTGRLARFVVSVATVLGLAVTGTAATRASAAQDAAANGQPLPRLAITVFQAPSQSVWIPALISRLGLDRKHGFELVITQKPSKVAYTDFATGKDPVCFCAAIAAVARFKQQGANITLLWNIFDFEWDMIVKAGEIDSIDQIVGKTIQADTITGGWALSKWFLQARGIDLSKVNIKSSSVSGAGALAELQLGRIDGLLVNPVEAAAAVTRGNGQYAALPLFDRAIWQKVSNTEFLPSITLGVQSSWLADPQNRDLARRFYQANVEAAEFIRSNPHEAAQLVAADARVEPDVMENILIRYRDVVNIAPLRKYLPTVALLTQKLLPEGGQLPRPLTDDELNEFVAEFNPGS